MRRQKSLRIGVHHANAVVWGPVRDRTRLSTRRERFDHEIQRPGDEDDLVVLLLERVHVRATAFGNTLSCMYLS